MKLMNTESKWKIKLVLVKHYLRVSYCHSILKGTNPDLAEVFLAGMGRTQPLRT